VARVCGPHTLPLGRSTTHLVSYDTNWAKARSLQGRSDDAILLKTLVSRLLPLADQVAALNPFFGALRDSLSEQRVIA
jgi:hypothetical protein